jgi:hypothetical protein
MPQAFDLSAVSSLDSFKSLSRSLGTRQFVGEGDFLSKDSNKYTSKDLDNWDPKFFFGLGRI